MADPAKVEDQNILPVQALFNLDNSFNTFIGQGQPFYATVNPAQTGLHITNSTIDSTTIGATTPSSAAFTTATVATAPTGTTDVANKQYVDGYVAGLSWKPPVNYGTTGNITLSGLTTQGGGDWASSLTAGMRVLVKNQTAQAENGIYVAASGAWTRSEDANAWTELVSAICFVESGSTLAGSAWYCPAQPGGTLGTTAVTWSNFSVAATYTAGTGLTLSGYQFSITNTGITAATYGSASSVPVYAVNAQGQLTSTTNTPIAINANQITSGSVTNAQLANSSVTLNGTSVSLGGSATITAANPNALTFGTGMSAGTYDGSSAKTINLANSGVSAATYGSASAVPVFAVNAQGQITSVTNTSIAIANTAVSGLGTMSTQNANAVAITGGTINGTSIGTTTPAAANFTTLAANTTTSTTPVLSFNAANTIAAFGSTTAGSYNQLIIQNKSGATGSSANYVISNDLGTDSTYYGEFGMNASGYASTTYADFFSMNNGVYFSAHDGDVSIGSGNGYKTYLAWGTSGQSAHVINASGAIGLSTNLGTTSGTTGTTGYGTSGQAMISGGSAAAPTWGTLGITGGGTNGTATPTSGAVAYGTGTAYAFTGAGTTGQVLTSNGSSAPTWTTPAAYATVTDDTTTNATRYLLFANQTTGNLTTEYVSSTKLKYNPSTGALTASQLIIAP
jgi:hypothetical protein